MTATTLPPLLPPLLTSTEVCATIGVPYRFLHYVVNTGIFMPTVGPRGSGSQMQWSWTDAKVLYALRVLSEDVHIGGSGLSKGLRSYVAAIREAIERRPDDWTIIIQRGRVSMLIDLVPKGER